MSKKLWSLISITLIAAMLLAACGTPTPAQPTKPVVETKIVEATTAPEATTKPPEAMPTEVKPTFAGKITLWHGWKENEIASLNDVIAAFQAKYPDVQFDVLYVPFDDLRGKFETAAATGAGPTVLIGASDWGPALFDASLVADLKGMATTDFLQTINPAALKAVNYREALIGLPETLKGVVMFRNKKIIANAPATFDELVTAATAATQGDVVGADLERGFFFSAGHLLGMGGQLMDDKGNPLFKDISGIQWIDFLKRFSEAGPTEYYTDNDVNLFKAGKAGIIIDGTWNGASLAEAIGADNLVVDPWPKKMSGFVQTENIYVSANVTGDDQKVAWEFLKFFLSPDAQALLADPKKAGHIPSVTGVNVTDPLLKQEVIAFEGGVAFPVIPEMGAYWGPMDTALKSAFDQGTDSVAAISKAYNDVSAAVATIKGQAPAEIAVTGNIKLWHGWKENEIASLNEVIAAFQAKNPNVTFDVLYVPFDDLRGKFETASASGAGPTLLIGAADWGPALYDATLVESLTPLSSSVFEASILPAALGAVQYKGALIGLPETIKGVVMFRNKAIIPEPPATITDVISMAKAATTGDIVGADLERGFFFSAAHLNGVGGQLMDSKGNPLFNDAKGVEWIKLLASFSEAGPVEYYTDNDVNLFKAGKCGIIIDGSWNAASLADAIGKDNLVVDPWPKPLSGFVQTENIYLSSNVTGDDQKAAWAFMKFLVSPEAQALLADPTKAGHVPSATNVKISDPLMLQEVAAFSTGVAFPVIPEMGSYWGPMDTALKSVFDQGMDITAALQKAFDDITAAIKTLRGE